MFAETSEANGGQEQIHISSDVEMPRGYILAEIQSKSGLPLEELEGARGFKAEECVSLSLVLSNLSCTF